MEMIAMLASFTGLFIAGANVAIFCIIKFNDLSHLQKGLEEIKDMLRAEALERKESQREIWQRLDSTTERVAKVEGRLAQR